MIGNRDHHVRAHHRPSAPGATVGPRRRANRQRGILALLAILTVAATCSCESSGTGAPASSTEQPSTPVSSSNGSARSPADTGSPADAATTAAIKSAYRKLFAPSTPINESINALQNGAAFKQALIEQSKSPMAKKSSAAASKVTLLSADLARVTYSILLAGTPVLKDQTGYAVREDGTWKVADKTFCGLLALNGSAPAACKRPGATTLPGTG
jgi:hypothetical protein